MKSLENLSSIEKAKLLHDLFPKEIPGYLVYVERLCDTIKEDEANNRKSWENGLMTFDFWLNLITQTQRKIEQYGIKLHQSSKVFAEQLFEGHLALFQCYVLHLYTHTRQHPNQKFTAAIELFYKG